jgi:5-aminolevulinate synthase
MVDVWESLKLPFVEEPNIVEFKRVAHAAAEPRCAFPEFKRAAE